MWRWNARMRRAAVMAVVAIVASCGSDGSTTPPQQPGVSLLAERAEVSSVSAYGLQFDHQVIDPSPPSGDGCCLDVISVGDIDGDGASDVIVGAEHADGLSWYQNPGPAAEAATWERYVIGSGDFTTDGEVADIDADGDLDVVASSIDRDIVEWWEQVGEPTTAAGWERHDVGADFAHDTSVVDVDGDGRLDVAAYHVDAQRLDWYQQPADPASSWTPHTVDERPGEGLAAEDVDGDGDQDLVGGPAVYVNADGRGTSWDRVALSDTWESRARPAVGDIDGDGQLDIVLSSPETDGPLAWFEGPDWVEHEIEGAAGYTHSLELGDVDLDGDLDLMTGVMHWAGTHEVRVLLGDGGATWTPVLLASTGTHNARLVDLDRDGRLDVVGKNFDGPKQVEVWWNHSPADNGVADVESPLDGFSRMLVDDDRGTLDGGTPYFGLGFGDLDGDGDDDIASGGYLYLATGDPTSPWTTVDLAAELGTDVDAMLVGDVDGDGRIDVVAEALPDVWLIRLDDDGASWVGRVVAQVPATPRPNGQGYRLGDLVGTTHPEIVLSGGEEESDVWYLTAPDDPTLTEWPAVRITEHATDEQVAIGDIDGDGDNDVVAGDMKDGGSYIAWFANPGDGSADWERHRLGEFPGVFPDRLEVGDIDGDGRLDVVVSEENGGEAPDAEVSWYRQPEDPASDDWPRTVVVTQYTTNGLSLDDLDADGDLDLVTGEHRGTKKLSVWENQGPAGEGAVGWSEHPVDQGIESHLGARTWDLDGDGDLDITSIGFDDPDRLYVWFND